MEKPKCSSKHSSQEAYAFNMEAVNVSQQYDSSSQFSNPSKYHPQGSEFQFISTSPITGSSVSGDLSGDDPPAYDDVANLRKRSGKGAAFLESKGFGWLMEVQDDDEDSQKPLLEELDIDLRDIYYKLRCVLLPVPRFGYNTSLVRDSPDFWGPLVVVLLYSLVSLYGQFRVVSWILTIWICGSLLVFMLARVLGGEVTYSQSLGVIGYSLLPLTVVALLLPLLNSLYYVANVCKLMGVVWATYSASSLLCVQELQHKRPLLLYPIFLLYVYFLSLYTGA